MVSKRDRLNEIIRRLRVASPFRDGFQARSELDRIMREVEDELSGVRFNPDAVNSPPDGRMYPPHDRFEIDSGSIRVRLFKQARHRTWIAENGALKIASLEGTIEIDLPGEDERTVEVLLENIYGIGH